MFPLFMDFFLYFSCLFNALKFWAIGFPNKNVTYNIFLRGKRTEVSCFRKPTHFTKKKLYERWELCRPFCVSWSDLLPYYTVLEQGEWTGGSRPHPTDPP